MASINLNNCIIPFESDEGILTEFVLKNPLMQSQMIKVALLQQNKKFKLIEIIKVVQKIRNQLFPKDTDQVFSTIFCKANDSEDPIFNLFRGTIKIPLITKKTTGNQEIVILANLPMLLKMSSENHWFIDATFKVTPHGFKQTLNILVFLPKLGIFYPTCHAFMTHKTQESYAMFFSFLKTLSTNHKLKFTPEVIMLDFEVGLRNALKEAFSDVKLSGCFFHFTKALWDKASKIGLRKKTLVEKTIVLVAYLQIIVHCPSEKRKELFAQVKEIFAKEKQYLNYFKYFEKMWLTNKFLDELFEALNPNESNFFIRTNNPIEQFHHFLSKLE